MWIGFQHRIWNYPLRIDIVELTEFDDTFIRRIVEQVTILSKDKIEVRFIGGFSKVGDIPTK